MVQVWHWYVSVGRKMERSTNTATSLFCGKLRLEARGPTPVQRCRGQPVGGLLAVWVHLHLSTANKRLMRTTTLNIFVFLLADLGKSNRFSEARRQGFSSGTPVSSLSSVNGSADKIKLK